MTTQQSSHLWVATSDDGVVSAWTSSTGDLHFHTYEFDDYNIEIITFDAAYEHRADIKALDWDTTHRQWTGNAWQIDFAALDTVVQHFLNRGYSVTIAAAELNIYLSDYDASFLKTQLPDEPPPDVESDAKSGEQTDFDAFSIE
ncbi:hypothetical protein [Haladaptatus halobius]|uniref:hypothetical protein n=1 Tax=Haladaptatus halobius TaxID=2884875 RepID=UPI001D0BA68C|nr:hypothetical protein [Haladaptatus halobius]